MPKINILPKEVYSLIAAGEVVERPLSIVKEMIENSIDAGAKHITVEIKNGGTTYIRITDDGCGIAKEDVKKVFISHATSKIADAEDLNSILTLGFRGEAMASIGAVAKVELLTRAGGDELGTRYEIHGGQEIDFSDAGCPEGTTIVVRDIFFNVPARMKFLKKDVTEGNSVQGIVERMAISHPAISFRFIREGRQVLVTSGNGDLKSTVYSVFGKELSDTLVPVDYIFEGMKVTGLVSRPHQSRKSRAMQFFFINSRLVKSTTAMAALEQAYKNSIMVGRYPACVLNIEIDAKLIDVNVHPAKIEVRFVNEKPVFNLIYYGVKTAIEAGDTVKQANLGTSYDGRPYKNLETHSFKVDFLKKEEPPKQMKFAAKPVDDFWKVASPAKPIEHKRKDSYGNVEDYAISAVNSIDKLDEAVRTDYSVSVKIDFSESEKKQDDSDGVIAIGNDESSGEKLFEITDEKSSAEQISDISEQSTEQTVEIKAEDEIAPDFTVVGEAFNTYIIVQIENNLYYIDKHAAHERMNFERLKAQAKDNISTQILLAPVAVKLSAEEYSVVTENLLLLAKCGIIAEDFGNMTVIVREIPSLLEGADAKDLIIETAGKLLEHKTDLEPDKMDWIFHSASCRSAVKGGDYTTPEERELFVKKLLSMPNIRYCPHGRPVMIKISKYEIEKQFGRIQ